jgi:UDP:flavonoid glycosyltransferase YjiC (YdhE family)
VAQPTIAVFCTAEAGHFKQLRPLISDLVQWGFIVHVFTHRLFSAQVGRARATFVDLFGKYRLERADSESFPFPCRYVSFAANYAEEVLQELKEIRPALVLYETFSVIGRLAAQRLGVPSVNMSAGHNVDPARYLSMLHGDPRVKIAESCHRAVETLRDRYQLSDASPFSYVTGLSPYLNIYPQPSAFLTEEERKVFEPVLFYGCLPAQADWDDQSPKGPRHVTDGPRRFDIYASCGTTALRYYADAAISLFRAVAECLESMPKASALISLGGATLDYSTLCSLIRPNVRVVRYTDQWSALRDADVFVTHHGLNSTHEAILHRVPMLSHPFFWDQPMLAEKCQQFGVAIPLARSPREPVSAGLIRGALHQVEETRDLLHASLDRARDWELDVIANRPSVLQRIADLV